MKNNHEIEYLPIFQNFITPWYKRIFHKHYWIKTEKIIPLATNGIYTKGFIFLYACSKCNKIKQEIFWEKRKQENL